MRNAEATVVVLVHYMYMRKKKKGKQEHHLDLMNYLPLNVLFSRSLPVRTAFVLPVADSVFPFFLLFLAPLTATRVY